MFRLRANEFASSRALVTVGAISASMNDMARCDFGPTQYTFSHLPQVRDDAARPGYFTHFDPTLGGRFWRSTFEGSAAG